MIKKQLQQQSWLVQNAIRSSVRNKQRFEIPVLFSGKCVMWKSLDFKKRKIVAINLRLFLPALKI